MLTFKTLKNQTFPKLWAHPKSWLCSTKSNKTNKKMALITIWMDMEMLTDDTEDDDDD